MPVPTLRQVTLTIASGQTAGTASIGDGMLVGLIWPAALTGTGVTPTASATLAGTYGSIYDTTDTVVGLLTKHNSATRALDPAVYAGIANLKLTSDQSEGADRTFILLVRN